MTLEFCLNFFFWRRKTDSQSVSLINFKTFFQWPILSQRLSFNFSLWKTQSGKFIWTFFFLKLFTTFSGLKVEYCKYSKHNQFLNKTQSWSWQLTLTYSCPQSYPVMPHEKTNIHSYTHKHRHTYHSARANTHLRSTCSYQFISQPAQYRENKQTLHIKGQSQTCDLLATRWQY